MLLSRTPAGLRRLAAALALIFGLEIPAVAQILKAGENPVNFYYSGDPWSLQPRPVAITLDGEPAAVTAVDFTVNPKPNGQEMFRAEAAGTNVNVGINTGALAGVGPGVYQGMLRIAAGADVLSLPVRLTIGPAAFSLSPATLRYQAAPGSQASLTQTITILTSAPETFSASATMNNGAGWLSISPVSGITSPDSNTIQATVSAAGLAAGTYTGKVTVTIGTTQRVTEVTLQVGGAGGLTFNPGSLAFAYSTTVHQVPAAQVLTITSATASAYSASPQSSGWLRVNGSAAGTGLEVLPASLNISVDPAGLSEGVYQGSVQVEGNDGSFGMVPVTLSVLSTNFLVTVDPPSLAFLGQAPEDQAIVIGTTTVGVTFTASSSQPWLTLSRESGTAPTTIQAHVNPSGLGNAVYTGYVTITFAGNATGSYQVYVVYTPGGTGGIPETTSAAPSQVEFSMEQGSSVPLPAREIVVTGIPGTTFTASAQPATGGNWLRVAADGAAVPAKAAITVDPAVASTLAAGQYNGTLAITSETGRVNVAVVLNIYEDPVLLTVRPLLTFYYDPASGTAPGAQYLSVISSRAGRQFAYTASSSAGWVQVHNRSGTTPGWLTAILDVSRLPAGVNTGAITITAAGAANSPVTIPVTVVIPGPQPGAVATPESLSFTAPVGQAASPQSLNIGGAPNTVFSVASDVSWLSLNPLSGLTPRTVAVTADAVGLASGTHSGTITVTAGGVTQLVPVTFTVGSATLANLAVETIGSPFEYRQGGALPAVKTVAVTSSGGALQFEATAASTGGWLSVSPAAASTPATLTISVNPAGLTSGTYTGTIKVTSPGAANSPQTRTVTLNVNAATSLNASPELLTFTYRTDGTLPGVQTVSVSSTNPATLPFSITSDAAWLRATPAAGITPYSLNVTADPAGLEPGTYTGRITVTSSAIPGASVTVEARLTVSGPLPTITAVVNAASYQAGAVAPGEMVTLFGTSLGPDELATYQLDNNGRVGTSLSDVRVLFNGIPAPLIYVSAGQVSAIVPYAAAGRASNSVWVEYQGLRSNVVALDGAAARPGLFTADASGSGAGAILNQDYSLNSPDNPAAPGSAVMLYLTGEGQTVPGGVDGHINRGPHNLPKPVLPVAVTIGNRPAKVLYQGAAPDAVSGLMQVNVEVPADAPAGVVPVSVSVAGASSQPGVTMAIR